jgi:ribosomal protein L4
VLLVEVSPSEALHLSARNLPKVEVRSVAGLHAYDVLAARKVLLSEEAAALLTERLAR